MKKDKTKNIALSAVFAAAITALTMVHLPVPGGSGYVHLGDGIIYILPSFLPLPYAAVTAGIGGALADLSFGCFNWLPFTFIIKGLNTLPFAIWFKIKNQDKISFGSSLLLALISGCITVIMYFVAGIIVYGNIASAALDIPGSVIQAVGSGLIYFFLGMVLPTSKIKNKINRR